MALTEKEREKLARQRAASRRRKKRKAKPKPKAKAKPKPKPKAKPKPKTQAQKKAALDKKSPANQGKKLTVRESNANRVTLPTGKSQISHIQSGDFYTGDHKYAGMTIAEQAAAQGRTLSSVRRDRRLDFDRNEQRAVTEQNLAKVKAGEMTLTEALQGTVDHQRITRSPGGRKTASYKQERKGTQKEQVLQQTGLPEYYRSNRDGTRDDGKGNFIYALNTGYGIDIPQGYEIAGKDQDNTPGNYVRLKEKKVDEWYKNPGQLIKLAATTALGAGVGSAFSAAAGAAGLSSTAANIARGVGSGLTSGGISGARGSDLLEAGVKGGVLGGVAPVLDKVPGLNDPNLVSSFGRGTVNDLVGQAVMDGKIDFEDALKSGLISSGFDTLKDLGGDVLQTNDGQLIEGVDQIDEGRTMTADDVTRLTNTSDLYGLLGEKGLLSKIGLNPSGDAGGLFSEQGYLNTGYLGDAASLILGPNTRPIANQKAALDARTEEHERITQGLADGTLSPEDARAATAAAETEYLQSTARYDERALKFLPRGDQTRSGIYEFENEAPGAGTGFLETLRQATGGNPFTGQDVAAAPAGPQQGSGPDDDIFTPLDDPAYQEYMASNPTADIGDTNTTPISDQIFPELAPEPAPPPPTTPPVQEEEIVPEEELIEGDLSQEDWEKILQEYNEQQQPETTPTYPEDPADPTPTYPASEPTPTYPPADPEYVEEPTPTYPTPTPPPPPPPPPSGPPGPKQGVARRPAEIEEEVFRLARVLEVLPLDARQKQGVRARIEQLLAEKEGAVTGDVTTSVDPNSSKYIQWLEQEKALKQARKGMMARVAENKAAIG